MSFRNIKKKRIFLPVVVILAAALIFGGCSGGKDTAAADDIIILYTNDVHCAYDFCGESGEELYECVQENVDACVKDGADYVVVLAHLGTDEASSPFTSSELIANTKGSTPCWTAIPTAKFPFLWG